MKLRRCLMIFIILLLLLTGCWDRREIEERGFVIGLGLDTAPPPETTSLEPAGRKGYEVTIQVALPSQIAGSEGSGGRDVDPFWNITTTGSGILEAIRETYMRVNRQPFFAFTQVVVIGEELARRGIQESIDLLLRDAEMRRKVVAYVATGRAKDVLAIKPRLEPINAFYLGQLAWNETRSSKIALPMDLGKLGSDLHEDAAFVLPRVQPGKEDAKVSGASLFKGDKMLGWLNEQQTEAYRWITNKVKKATVTVLMEGREVVFDVSSACTVLSPVLEGDTLSFILKVRTEGDLGEKQVLGSGKDALTPDFLLQVEEMIAQQIRNMMLKTIAEVQQRYGADIFGFGRALERRYPSLWKELKPRWDEVFPTVAVEVEVDTDIRRVGLER